MSTYLIREHEVPLFPMKYVRSIFGCSRSGVLQKESRGQLHPANWRDEHNNRLYSIEDLAIIEYIYKEVWPFRQGVPTPDWVKEMVMDALVRAKRVVLEYGSSQTAEDWEMIHKKYNQFNKYRAQVYIESWRRRLLDVNQFFPELCEEYDEV